MALAVLLLAMTSCSGGDDDAASPDRPANSLAELAVIDTLVDVRPAGTDSFEPGDEGQPLAVGDSIRTNTEGFGEVNYFDGSVTRVSQDAEFTMVALSNDEGDRRVETRLDSGTSWSRVERLSGSEGAYSVDTPVALATATGTAFVVDCTDLPTTCTFWATEGTVTLTAEDGSAIAMSAPSRLAVEEGEPLGTPEPLIPDAMYEDTWVGENTDLDIARDDQGDGGSDDGSGSDDGGTGSDHGSGTGTGTGTGTGDDSGTGDGSGTGDDSGTDSGTGDGGSGDGETGAPAAEDLALATIAGEWDTEVVIDQAASDPCCDAGAAEDWDISLTCSEGADCTVNREAGVADDVSEDVITAVSPGVYDITATSFEPCVDQGTGDVTRDAGFDATKTGRYTVTDAELVDGRWEATEVVGEVVNTYTLNAAGIAAGCAPRGDGATDTVVVDVTASR